MSSYSNSSFSFFHTNIRSLNVIWKISSLRSKRFQSSYGAKVSAGAKKRVFFAFVPTFLDELARKPLLLRLENFQTHLLDELTFRFNILGITETRIKTTCDNLDFNPTIPHYITLNMCQQLFQLDVLACISMRLLNTQLSKNVLMRLFSPSGLSYTYPNMQI